MGKERAIETLKPDLAAAFILEQADPFAVITHVAKECGMPAATAKSLVKRMRTRYQKVNTEVKRVTTNELVKQLDDKIQLALSYMDDYSFSSANLRDLSIALGILIEKKQLLSHEPTQIISVEERKHLDELMPQLLRIAQSRGITIDVNAEEVRALPRHEPIEKDLSATARRMQRTLEDQDMVLD